MPLLRSFGIRRLQSRLIEAILGTDGGRTKGAHDQTTRGSLRRPFALDVFGLADRSASVSRPSHLLSHCRGRVHAGPGYHKHTKSFILVADADEFFDCTALNPGGISGPQGHTFASKKALYKLAHRFGPGSGINRHAVECRVQCVGVKLQQIPCTCRRSHTRGGPPRQREGSSSAYFSRSCLPIGSVAFTGLFRV